MGERDRERERERESQRAREISRERERETCSKPLNPESYNPPPKPWYPKPSDQPPNSKYDVLALDMGQIRRYSP